MATNDTSNDTSTETREAQVCCAGVSYFEQEAVLLPTGEPRKDRRGEPITVTVRREAQFGAIVTLSEHEYLRLLALGAVQEPGSAPLPGHGPPKPTPFSTPVRQGNEVVAAASTGDPTPPNGLTLDRAAELTRMAAGESEVLDPETATVEELAAWIKEDKPKVGEVVDAADGDPVVAQKLLDAERMATGDNPRSTLERELQSIVDSADDEAGDGDDGGE